jgi:DNA-binding beta-propeller fold protein YncE
MSATTGAVAPSGERELQYDVVEGFFKRPRKWTFCEVADVDVDADDNVYVFTRGPRPVMIFDRNGDFLDAWGDAPEPGRMLDSFTFPHGITVAGVFTVDADDHTARKWTRDGKLLLTIGKTHQNAAAYSGQPFNRPTAISLASNGDIYVSDGYLNARVHCFDASGELKFSWGTRGGGPGEFDTAHGIYVDQADGDRVYVADRHNNRVQFFTPAGGYLGEWGDLHLVSAVRKGPDGNFYVAEMFQRVTVLSPRGEVLARWGDKDVVLSDEDAAGGGLPSSASHNPWLRGVARNEPGAARFCAPHGIASDSRGAVYVADVALSRAGLDRGDRSIQKFVRR